MTKLKIFIVAQFVLGNLVGFVAMGFLPYPFAEYSGYVYMGWAVSQVSLLGFWAGMGLSEWWKRLLGIFAGIAGLWIVGFVMMGTDSFEMLRDMSVIACVVSLASILIRTFGVQLQRISEEKKNNPAPKMQFTIRGLFLVTFCAALLLLLARVNRDGISTHGGSAVLISLEYDIVIIFATLLCMWAALSLSSPYLPAVIALAAFLLMSLVLLWTVGEDFWAVQIVMVLVTIFISYFIWTLATLLVLRSCGYRLTSKQATAPTPTV